MNTLGDTGAPPCIKSSKNGVAIGRKFPKTGGKAIARAAHLEDNRISICTRLNAEVKILKWQLDRESEEVTKCTLSAAGMLVSNLIILIDSKGTSERVERCEDGDTLTLAESTTDIGRLARDNLKTRTNDPTHRELCKEGVLPAFAESKTGTDLPTQLTPTTNNGAADQAGHCAAIKESMCPWSNANEDELAWLVLRKDEPEPDRASSIEDEDTYKQLTPVRVAGELTQVDL